MKRHDQLWAFFKELGEDNVKYDTLIQKKRVQKLIYIAKQFNIKFEFEDYNWYLYGPYSPQLTKAIFDVLERDVEIAANAQLTINDKSFIKKMQVFLGKDIFNIQMLELIASLMFLRIEIKKENKNPEEFEEYITNRLMKLKPQYDKRMIRDAWHRIRTKEMLGN